MAIREGRWDCSSCGSKGIYGRHVDCPGCGRPRPAGVRFYLSDDAPVITDAAQLAEARAGADWACEHCAATNRATLAECGGCGAPKGSSPTQRVADYDNASVPRAREAAEPEPEPAPAPPTGPRWVCGHCESHCHMQSLRCYQCGEKRGSHPPRPDPWAPPSGAAGPKAPGARAVQGEAALGGGAAESTRSYVMHALAAGFVFLCALIGWAAWAGARASSPGYETVTPYRAVAELPPVTEAAVVAGKEWEREIAVQVRRLERGAGPALPAGAILLTTQQRLAGHRRVVDRYETRTRVVRDRVAIPDGYETRTHEVEERVRTGTRTYVCGQRDLGNGYFEDRECSEPVYETRTRTETSREPKYRYETRIDTVTDRTPVYRREPYYNTWYTWNMPVWRDTVLTASGETTAPAWPAVRPGPDLRPGERTERYAITVRAMGNGEETEVEVPMEEWARHRIGTRIALRYHNLAYTLLPADSLPGCMSWHAGRAAAPPDSLGCSPAPPRDSTSADTARDSASAAVRHSSGSRRPG